MRVSVTKKQHRQQCDLSEGSSIPSIPASIQHCLRMEHLFRGVGRLSSVVLHKGQGSYVYATTGEAFLDFTSGIGVVNTGHCHPTVVQAAQEQCANLIHAQVNLAYHEPMLALTNDLLQHALQSFPSLSRIFYATTGAEAVENAIKVAKYATKRPYIVCFQGGYHGRTQLTMSLTTSSNIYRQYMTTSNNILVAPFPYELHGDTSESCLNALNLMLKQQVVPSEVAAMIIEPILGEGGYVPAPLSFLQGLRSLCNQHNIVLIVDEVQTGFGRTGDWFATPSADIEPDILIMAKGLASGFPLSAIAATSALADLQVPGTMGGTYSGNVVACAAALATQQVIRNENLLENSRTMGLYLKDQLELLQQEQFHHLIRDVRGRGCMIGVEFNDSIVPLNFAKSVSQECFQRGMLLLSASVYPTIRFIPPLTVTRDEIDIGLDIFATALRELEVQVVRKQTESTGSVSDGPD